MISVSRSRLVVIAVAVLVVGVFGMSGGCYAYKRPPALSAEEQALLQDPPLPYSVTVAWWDDETKTGQSAEAYNGSLAKIVADSGAFATSRYERSPAPSNQDLVATSTGLYCNTAVIPFVSAISLGLVPTVFQDEQCEGMLLRRAAGRPKSEGVEIEVRYKGTVVMGWAGVALGALPGWGWGSVERDSRYAERFRLAVVRRRADIDRLVQR
jgi:hypothetical protein